MVKWWTICRIECKWKQDDYHFTSIKWTKTISIVVTTLMRQLPWNLHIQLSGDAVGCWAQKGGAATDFVTSCRSPNFLILLMSIHKIEEVKPTSQCVAKINFRWNWPLVCIPLFFYCSQPKRDIVKCHALFCKAIWQCTKKLEVVTQKTRPLGIYLQ